MQPDRPSPFILSLLTLLTAAPALAAVDLSSPKSAAKSFYEAVNNGDANALRDCLLIEGKDQEQLAAAFSDVILAGKRLADAAHEKFSGSSDKLAAGALPRED